MRMQSCGSLVCLAAVALLGAAPLTASAGPLFNVDFNHDTLGQAPTAAKPKAGAVNTNPTHLRLNKGANVVVKAGYTDPGTNKTLGGPDDKVAVIKDTSKKADAEIKLQTTKAGRISQGQVVIEFDMLIAKLKQDSGNLIVGVQTYPHTTPSLGRGPYAIGEVVINYQGPTSLVGFDKTKHVGHVTKAKQMTPRGKVVHVKYVLDFTTAKQTLTIGALPPIQAQLATDSNFGAVSFYSTTPAIGTVALDNITITSIPKTQ